LIFQNILKEIYVFSNNVNDLVKAGESATNNFSWDSNEDDPIISLKIEEDFFLMYIVTDTSKCINNIFIDSVNIELNAVFLRIE